MSYENNQKFVRSYDEGRDFDHKVPDATLEAKYQEISQKEDLDKTLGILNRVFGFGAVSRWLVRRYNAINGIIEE